MCLIAYNWRPGAEVPLSLIANRDEFYARPSRPLQRWEDGSTLAGKDLSAGGTWLGLSSTGRVAALTNYRDMRLQRTDAPSRGDITSAFLRSSAGCAEFLRALAIEAPRYNPFNLLIFDGQSAMGFESRHGRAFALPEGLGAVSNADFGTPWPKLRRLQDRFASHLQAQGATDGSRTPGPTDVLLALLADPQVATDAELPDTGLPVERERALSAAFIRTPLYGTRASSLLSVGRTQAHFVERSFDSQGRTGQAEESLVLTLER